MNWNCSDVIMLHVVTVFYVPNNNVLKFQVDWFGTSWYRPAWTFMF